MGEGVSDLHMQSDELLRRLRSVVAPEPRSKDCFVPFKSEDGPAPAARLSSACSVLKIDLDRVSYPEEVCRPGERPGSGPASDTGSSKSVSQSASKGSSKAGAKFSSKSAVKGDPKGVTFDKSVHKLSTYDDLLNEQLAKTIEDMTDKLPAVDSGNENLLPFEIWEPVAYDIAMGHADHDTVASGYGISAKDIDKLMQNDYFCKMLSVKREEVRTLGRDASFAVRMRMIAIRSLPLFFEKLTDKNTNNKDFYSLFKLAVDLARLTPVPNEPVAAPAGTTVLFNIHGVPGLDHLKSEREVGTGHNVNLHKNQEDVVDAQFTEVEFKKRKGKNKGKGKGS